MLVPIHIHEITGGLREDIEIPEEATCFGAYQVDIPAKDQAGNLVGRGL